jgi:hypothetical protein
MLLSKLSHLAAACTPRTNCQKTIAKRRPHGEEAIASEEDDNEEVCPAHKRSPFTANRSKSGSIKEENSLVVKGKKKLVRKEPGQEKLKESERNGVSISLL